MSPRCLLLPTLAMLLAGCGSDPGTATPAKPDPAREIRVPVTFAIRAKTGGFGGEWVGKLSLADWEAVRYGNPQMKFLEFSECYFIDEKGERVPNGDTKGPNGVQLGYSNTMVLNVDSIFRLMPGFTTETLGDTMKVHLNPGLEDRPVK